MGYYLNSDTPFALFREVVYSRIFVDKSLLMQKVSEQIHTTDKYICITRPRRFGKTSNALMLGAYYARNVDSRNLFSSLKIASVNTWLEHLNQYNVIYIDFSRMPFQCNSYDDYISSIYKGLEEDLVAAYPYLAQKRYDDISKMFLDSKSTFVFILDEWDSIFNKKFMTEEDKCTYLGFLKNLLKDQPYVSLAYMTGVLPVAKYSSGSELNMFDEYSFMNDNVYDVYFGFLEEEVWELCRQYPTVPFEEVRRWYDGYYTSDGKSLFNPRSVNRALTRGICLNYWTETGPMNEIADCIEHNIDEVREDIVKMVSGIPVAIKLNGYSASESRLHTRNEILSAMVVYGFLSYHEGILRIPNCELMERYQEVLKRESMGEVKLIVDRSREMLAATYACDGDKVASILEDVHDREIPFLKYGDENSLSCVITLCYLYARDEYTIEREAKSGKGYCDYLFLPKNNDKPAIILELKVGGTCENAIAQIKSRNYLEKVKNCREILLVGINYDKVKHHECHIEKITQSVDMNCF